MLFFFVWWWYLIRRMWQGAFQCRRCLEATAFCVLGEQMDHPESSPYNWIFFVLSNYIAFLPFFFARQRFQRFFLHYHWGNPTFWCTQQLDLNPTPWRESPGSVQRFSPTKICQLKTYIPGGKTSLNEDVSPIQDGWCSIVMLVSGM